MLGDKRVGILNIIEKNKKITKGDIDALMLLNSLIALEMQKSELIRQNKGSPHESIISDLLEGRIQSPKRINNRLSLLDWKLKKHFFIIVLKSENYLTVRQLVGLQEQIGYIFFQSKSLVYNESIVVVMNKDEETPFSDTSIINIEHFLVANNMHCGVSQLSQSILELSTLHKQALKAITIGSIVNTDTYIFYYSNYKLYDIIDTCFANSTIANLCLDSLFVLIEYDKSHNTDFTNTLKTYIYNKYNQLETSRVLHIHRGTLIYRLGRIQSIMNINLNDNTTALHIQLSFFIMEYDSKKL